MIKQKRFLTAFMWIGFAAFLIAYIGFSLTGFSDAIKYKVLGIAYMVPVFAAVAATIAAFTRVTKAEKRFWLSLAAATTLLALGELYWIFIQFTQSLAEPPQPSFSDYVSTLAYIFLFLMLISMARLSNTFAVTKAKYLVDTLIGVIFAAVVVFAAVLRPLIVSGELVHLSGAINLVFPVFDIGLILGISANLFGFKKDGWRLWEIIVSIGIGFMTVADIGFSFLSLQGLYDVGFMYSNLIDVLFMTSFFLFFIASLARMREDVLFTAPRDLRKIAKTGSGRREVVVYGLILANMPVFLYLVSKGTQVDYLGVVVFGAALGLLIMIRAVLVVTENNRVFSNAIIDPVTGTYNYRFFQQKMLEEIDRAVRYGKSLSVVFLDLDDFSRINSVHGYAVGDSVLADVAAMINAKIRISDVVCRIGGDEFCILMPETQAIEALKTALRIQQGAAVYSERIDIEVCCSIGISAFPQHGVAKEDLERGAESAMSWAKFHGKNQIAIFDNKVMDDLRPQDRVKKAEELAYMNTVQGLAAAVDARDPYTQNHSRNVAALAAELSMALGFPEDHVKMIETAALLHDVGKIGIADNILKKPGALTPEEREVIQEHPLLSQKILAATSLQEILPWIGAHHERWDGTGYPQGLQGVEIPIEARILAICDVYDALMSDRPYRSGMPFETAIAILSGEKDAQFDAHLTEVFLELMEHAGSIKGSAVGS